MSEQTGVHGPRIDDEIGHETAGLLSSGHSTRAEEFRDPEPSADDQPVVDAFAGHDETGGTPVGMTGVDVETRAEVARFLGIGAFPGTRDDLLATARENSATDAVLTTLARLPEGETFGNMQDVSRAAGLGVEEQRT